MLFPDKDNLMQKNPEVMQLVCATWMEHYNFMLSVIGNTEVDNFFYQEYFDEFKWYDV